MEGGRPPGGLRADEHLLGLLSGHRWAGGGGDERGFGRGVRLEPGAASIGSALIGEAVYPLISQGPALL